MIPESFVNRAAAVLMLATFMSAQTSEASIAPGDVIESLDNHSAQEMMLTQLRDLLSQANARYSMTIIRAGKHLRFVIQLRPLL